METINKHAPLKYVASLALCLYAHKPTKKMCNEFENKTKKGKNDGHVAIYI